MPCAPKQPLFEGASPVLRKGYGVSLYVTWHLGVPFTTMSHVRFAEQVEEFCLAAWEEEERLSFFFLNFKCLLVYLTLKFYAYLRNVPL